MRPFSFEKAFDRHAEIDASIVSVRDLSGRFETGDDVAALLRRMGPFDPTKDAFRFDNAFAITGEQLEDFAEMLSEQVVNAVVDQTVGRYVEEMSGIDLNPLPLVETRIPDEVIDFVADQVGREATRLIFDLAANLSGSNYGRCGGMAFAGYDFYLAGWPIDDTITTPPTEGPLGDYIYERLLDSLRLNIGTFADWTLRLHALASLDEIATAALASAVGSVLAGGPIGALLGAYLGGKVDIFDLGRGPAVLLEPTKREWTLLKETLDEQAAWPVGLIYGNKPFLWEQHQVLAIGYDDEGAGRGTLHIWDNNWEKNHKNERSSMSLDFSGDELRAAGRHPSLKGFFRERYSTQRPPQALHG
jgi:hypothetical protein